MAETRKFIRFGKLPEGGKSWNSMDSRYEDGISCYELVKVGREWRMNGAWGSYRMLLNSDLPLYEVSGELLSERGADGEPLLKNATIVKRVRKQSYRDCWQLLEIEALGNGERIYRHCISGELWCILNGAWGACEFRCSLVEVADSLRVYLRERATILEPLLMAAAK